MAGGAQTHAAIHLDLRSGKVANLPAFLRHFTEARPLLVVVSRRFESRASSARPNVLLISKDGCARKEIIFM